MGISRAGAGGGQAVVFPRGVALSTFMGGQGVGRCPVDKFARGVRGACGGGSRDRSGLQGLPRRLRYGETAHAHHRGLVDE
jgi:hypothetical protein